MWRIGVGLLTVLFSILVVGPLGNWFYDLYVEAPTPRALALLLTIWPWTFIGSSLVGMLTLFGWLNERKRNRGFQNTLPKTQEGSQETISEAMTRTESPTDPGPTAIKALESDDPERRRQEWL